MDVWPRSGYYYPIPYSNRYGTPVVSYLRCTCECYCDQPFDLRTDALQRVRRVYDVRGVSAQENPKDLNDVFSVIKPGRRNRTTYKRWQIEELERAFLLNPYPTSVFKKTLALRLGLRDSRVQVWFQNRRAKSKRDRQICQSPTFSTSTTLDHESDHLSTCAEDDDADHYQDVTEDSKVDVEDESEETTKS